MKRAYCFFLSASVLVLTNGQNVLLAQDLHALKSMCLSRMPVDQSESCHSAVYAAQSIRSLITIADGVGSEIAGSSSVIGRNYTEGLVSRNLSASLSTSIVRREIPSLGVMSPGQIIENGLDIYAIKATIVAGLFEGLTISPGVRGILGLDVLGSFSSQFLIWNNELPTKQMGVGSLGLRLGVLRESFSVPGITVSLVRQFESALEVQSVRTDHTDLLIKSESTRIRATIGKDLGRLSVLAGVGWNRNTGLLQGRIPGMLLRVAHTFSSSFTQETQRLYFAGLSLTKTVFQWSFEFGLAEGLGDSNLEYGSSDLIPFGQVALRARF